MQEKRDPKGLVWSCLAKPWFLVVGREKMGRGRKNEPERPDETNHGRQNG